MQIKRGGTAMNIDMTAVLELIKKLVLMIFEKYEVIKEFNDLSLFGIRYAYLHKTDHDIPHYHNKRQRFLQTRYNDFRE